jgi:AcrR family transcriptional regulator
MAKMQNVALREQKFTLVRDEILRAATELFAARGYRAVTTDDIAEAIGFTKSAMYYYFRNKYDLLSLIFRESFAYYLRHARAIVNQKGDPRENLRALIIRHTLNALEMREWTMIYFRDESELNEKDRALLNKNRKEYAELFTQTYGKGVRAGVLRDIDPTVVVNGIIGACNAIAIRRRADESQSLQEFASAVADLLAQGYEAARQAP